MGFSLDEVRYQLDLEKIARARKRSVRIRNTVITRISTALGAALILIAGVRAFFPQDDGAAMTAAQNRRDLPIYCVDTAEKKVAISFDAAWGADKTSGIMDILEEYNVQATFYLVGFWVDKYPDKVKEIHERGFEIGNHSSTHPKMSTLTRDQMLMEVVTCADKIELLTGIRPTLFRPPYGDYNETLVTALRDIGYHTTQWNTDSLDWKNLGVQSMVRQVTSNVEPGDLVLFHNNSDYILDALPLILEWFKKNGYEVTSVGELLIKGDYYVDNAGRMRALKQ